MIAHHEEGVVHLRDQIRIPPFTRQQDAVADQAIGHQGSLQPVPPIVFAKPTVGVRNVNSTVEGNPRGCG